MITCNTSETELCKEQHIRITWRDVEVLLQRLPEALLPDDLGIKRLGIELVRRLGENYIYVAIHTKATCVLFVYQLTRDLDMFGVGLLVLVVTLICCGSLLLLEWNSGGAPDGFFKLNRCVWRSRAGLGGASITASIVRGALIFTATFPGGNIQQQVTQRHQRYNKCEMYMI